MEPTKRRYPQGCPRGGKDELPNWIDPRLRRIRIHQARLRCLTMEGMTQHTEVISGETQEEPGL